MDFPPPVAYINGLVLEGLGILGGKPKLGKSWWVMSAGLTIASGGVAFGNPDRQVTRAPVLLLALEDGPARLQKRLNTLLPPSGTWPEYLTCITEWPRFQLGGLDVLSELIDRDGFKVVIIDTLARVRKPRRGGGDAYLEDTGALAEVHDMTRARPGLSVLMVHHNRKNDDPDDYVDALSGTTGISGVVDHISVLQRGRGQADGILRFTSRDAAEHDTAFSLADGMWTELGDAALYAQSQARRSLLDALNDIFDGEAALTELSEYVGKKPHTILEQLRGLQEDGLVRQERPRGPWMTTEHTEIPKPEQGSFGHFGNFGGSLEGGNPDTKGPDPDGAEEDD